MSTRAVLAGTGSLAGVLGVVGFILQEFSKLEGVPLPAWVLGLVGIIGAAVAAAQLTGAGQVNVSDLPSPLAAKVKAFKSGALDSAD